MKSLESVDNGLIVFLLSNIFAEKTGMEEYRVAVLGGGSFGTVIAHMMADNGHRVTLWLRNEKDALAINRDHCNPSYLPELSLNPVLQAETVLATAVQSADIIFSAVPSSACRSVAQSLSPYLRDNIPLISTAKGIEAEHFTLMSEVLAEEIPQARIAVLSGPNLAKEMAAKQITATVIASRDEMIQRSVQDLLQSQTFRVYTSTDLCGVELGGALKNVYAIIAGMAAARGVGQNTISLLMTRSLAEMCRFAVHRGADPMTFLGLAGVGDLIATCMSPLSRNYRVGFELGKGKKLTAIIAALGQVAEGIETVKLLTAEAAKQGVYMPLVAALYEVIYHHKTIDEVVGVMMMSGQQRDVEFGLK